MALQLTLLVVLRLRFKHDDFGQFKRQFVAYILKCNLMLKLMKFKIQSFELL